MLPPSAASTGAAKSKNVTADETGFPGNPKNGTARNMNTIAKLAEMAAELK